MQQKTSMVAISHQNHEFITTEISFQRLTNINSPLHTTYFNRFFRTVSVLFDRNAESFQLNYLKSSAVTYSYGLDEASSSVRKGYSTVIPSSSSSRIVCIIAGQIYRFKQTIDQPYHVIWLHHSQLNCIYIMHNQVSDGAKRRIHVTLVLLSILTTLQCTKCEAICLCALIRRYIGK